MPSKMKQLLDMIGVADDARMFANTGIGSDGDYGKPLYPLANGSQDVLFPALTSHF